MRMTIRWKVNWGRVAAEDKQVFSNMDTLLATPMERITQDSRSGVSRLALSSVYYVKLFSGRRSRLQYLLGTSRFQRELRNLKYFAELGLPTPPLAAYGSVSTAGILQRSLIVTGEVVDATDLDQFIASGEFYARGVNGARKVLSQLAEATRILHAQGFYHRDLKTRNVLVRYHNDEPELLYFDCPRGSHPPRFLLRRCIVRELAHIERGLRHHVRAVDLLYMYKQYRRCNRLSGEDKALARDALLYYKQRKMTSERRSRLANQLQE